MSATQMWIEELDAPFPISEDQRSFFAENGYIKLHKVLSAELLRHYRAYITAKVAELTAEKLPLEQRSTYDKAFLQVGNLWLKSDEAREFVFGKRLARIAADLMGCRGVRLYHDQALYKEPGGGITPWHADQYYFPVSNDNVVTAWVPLQDTPLEMGPLGILRKKSSLSSRTRPGDRRRERNNPQRSTSRLLPQQHSLRAWRCKLPCRLDFPSRRSQYFHKTARSDDHNLYR